MISLPSYPNLAPRAEQPPIVRDQSVVNTANKIALSTQFENASKSKAEDKGSQYETVQAEMAATIRNLDKYEKEITEDPSNSSISILTNPEVRKYGFQYFAYLNQTASGHRGDIGKFAFTLDLFDKDGNKIFTTPVITGIPAYQRKGSSVVGDYSSPVGGFVVTHCERNVKVGDGTVSMISCPTDRDGKKVAGDNARYQDNLHSVKDGELGNRVKTTAGCVSVEETKMLQLMAILETGKKHKVEEIFGLARDTLTRFNFSNSGDLDKVFNLIKEVRPKQSREDFNEIIKASGDYEIIGFGSAQSLKNGAFVPNHTR